MKVLRSLGCGIASLVLVGTVMPGVAFAAASSAERPPTATVGVTILPGGSTSTPLTVVGTRGVLTLADCMHMAAQIQGVLDQAQFARNRGDNAAADALEAQAGQLKAQLDLYCIVIRASYLGLSITHAGANPGS